jgi:hypothetical protein
VSLTASSRTGRSRPETLDVDIGPDSRDAATMKRDGVWTIPDGRVELIGDNALARRTHVHRLESGVADGQHDADHRTAKVKALGELLGERTEWPVIVWCTWRRTMDLVTVEAERLGLTVGEISGASKSGLSAAGRADEGVDVVVCQVAAASEGIELVEAELAVWVDLPTSLTLWRQAVGRNDRAAESTHWREPVAVVLLGGEVDRTIWAALRRNRESPRRWRRSCSPQLSRQACHEASSVCYPTNTEAYDELESRPPKVRISSARLPAGLYFSPDAVAAYVREVQAVADELIGGLPGFRLDDVESARVALIGVRATPDESKAATMVARLIAAREIERGLLG